VGVSVGISEMPLLLLLVPESGDTIDLLLKDQQSVGKRSLHLMDTVNAKKRCATIYRRVNKFLKESQEVTSLLKNEHHFWKLTTLMIFNFWNAWLSSLLCYSVSGNANCMGDNLHTYWDWQCSLYIIITIINYYNYYYNSAGIVTGPAKSMPLNI
jgi:hypothetical protein